MASCTLSTSSTPPAMWTSPTRYSCDQSNFCMPRMTDLVSCLGLSNVMLHVMLNRTCDHSEGTNDPQGGGLDSSADGKSGGAIDSSRPVNQVRHTSGIRCCSAITGLPCETMPSPALALYFS